MLSKKHYQRVCPKPDTHDEIKARIKRNRACELARLDVSAKYPKITMENFEAANRYQEDRIRYWEINQ